MAALLTVEEISSLPHFLKQASTCVDYVGISAFSDDTHILLIQVSNTNYRPVAKLMSVFHPSYPAKKSKFSEKLKMEGPHYFNHEKYEEQ